jgi:hypothetical protein
MSGGEKGYFHVTLVKYPPNKDLISTVINQEMNVFWYVIYFDQIFLVLK